MSDENITTSEVKSEVKAEVKEKSLTQIIEAAALESAHKHDFEVKDDDGKVVEKEEAKDSKKVPEKKAESKEEEKKDDEKKSEEKKSDDLDDQQKEYAKVLYKALNSNDKEIQQRTLRILAESAGLKLAEVETKKEAAVVKKSIVESLKESLGEYDFLAEKLGPALETLLKGMVEESTKDIRETQRNNEILRIQNEVSTSIDAAFAEYENAKVLGPEVSKLMDQIKFRDTSGMTQKEYFKNLIILAASNNKVALKVKGEKVEPKVNEDKVNKNRNDAASRLASERGAEVKLAIEPAKRMNLKDAVEDAVRKTNEKFNS